MSDHTLKQIMLQLTRRPRSQQELTKMLKLSKSHMSAKVSTLMDLGLIDRIERAPGPEQTPGRPPELLRLRPFVSYSAVVINTLWEQRLYILTLGQKRPLLSLELSKANSAAALSLSLQQGLDQVCCELNLPRDKIKVLILATQASMTQGFAGVIYRDNVLNDANFPLAAHLTEALGLPVYLCNFAYAHLRCLLHSPEICLTHALALLCGEGSVALGIFIDGKILLGPGQSFLECSQLPFEPDFESALGTFGPDTARALYYAIAVLVPIFKLPRVILSGSCFDEHAAVIREVSLKLKEAANPVLRNLSVEYWPAQTTNYFDELALLSFEELTEGLPLASIKRSLSEVFELQPGVL